MKSHYNDDTGSEAPTEIWMIVDPCDGPHIFRSKSEATKTLTIWRKEAKNNHYDSSWDMTGPFKYTLDNKSRGTNDK